MLFLVIMELDIIQHTGYIKLLLEVGDTNNTCNKCIKLMAIN